MATKRAKAFSKAGIPHSQHLINARISGKRPLKVNDWVFALSEAQKEGNRTVYAAEIVIGRGVYSIPSSYLQVS
jgi:hypothetical protein